MVSADAARRGRIVSVAWWGSRETVGKASEMPQGLHENARLKTFSGLVISKCTRPVMVWPFSRAMGSPINNRCCPSSITSPFQPHPKIEYPCRMRNPLPACARVRGSLVRSPPLKVHSASMLPRLFTSYKMRRFPRAAVTGLSRKKSVQHSTRPRALRGASDKS
ncbi:MAG: hypothetical protein BWX84_03041 [Verrucomicrobia bacterium ADurb.Bin118]|nr:MAG: hypothetical protein BWX84_03041 [Verrucomicrobia bacterium ADurb.Bin118]